MDVDQARARDAVAGMLPLSQLTDAERRVVNAEINAAIRHSANAANFTQVAAEERQ